MEMAEYLRIAETEDEGARLMFRLRSGTSDLRVDRDRRSGVDHEDRCCTLCAAHNVEDVRHVLAECPAHEGARRSLLNKLPAELHDLHDDQVIDALMGSTMLRNLCSDSVARWAAIHAMKAFWARVFRLRRERGA